MKREQATIPRFSVILCTYNRRNLVLSALASLRRQTLPYSQFEIIVIDNGSSDGTLQAVRTYVSAGTHSAKKPEDIWRVQCLSEPLNGLAHARNTGLLVASGEIAVFLDDDTIADPNFLENLLTAYEETGADAIGGRVDIRFEASRPHWLTDDLLEMLGYFAPSDTRIQLKDIPGFSSSSFSVKIEALRNIGYFSPFLSKRLDLPASMEVHDLCYRLSKAGYTLWYEPTAVVAHRVPTARLKRAYFVGRAYWQGRSEVLAHYASTIHDEGATRQATVFMMSAIVRELSEIARLVLLHRPLLWLAGRSTNERLLAAMAQARSWGHVQQRWQFLEHAPEEVTDLAVLFVRPAEPDAAADLLSQSLTRQEVSCTTIDRDIPISWLWRHRALQGRSIGIIHFFRPGAFTLTHRQRRRFWFRLWLAQCWGIRTVTSDTGGWWQNSHGVRFLARRSLERKLMYLSHIVLAYTRQPEQLYPNKKLRRRVRCLPHPGFRGYYPPPLGRAEAHQQLGLPAGAGFVYLCLASAHTERELVYLLEAFIAMSKREKQQASPNKAIPHLLLVGSPGDKKSSLRVLKLAAQHSAIHVSPAILGNEDIPLYMGAADALVLPHFPVQTAGVLESAILALSYERVVVAPSLPRFRSMLPPQSSVLYDPGSRESLIQALVKVQTLDHHLSEYEADALEAKSGWEQYAHRLLKVYKLLLKGQ